MIYVGYVGEGLDSQLLAQCIWDCLPLKLR
jgi:hypothetical protein